MTFNKKDWDDAWYLSSLVSVVLMGLSITALLYFFPSANPFYQVWSYTLIFGGIQTLRWLRQHE